MEAKRVRLSVEPVVVLSDEQHDAIARADAGAESVDGQHPFLAREPRVIDIHADGTRVVEQPLSSEDRRRERLLRLWAERGNFAALREKDLADDEQGGAPEELHPSSPIAKLRALLAPSTSDAPAELPEADSKTGTIARGEFESMRDAMLFQLDTSLFNAEQAQNLLGMLIQDARGSHTRLETDAAAAALAVQSEYFLDPSALSLSALQIGSRAEDTSGASRGLRPRRRSR